MSLVSRLRLLADQAEIADNAESDFSRDLNQAADIIEAVDAWQRAPYDMTGIRWTALRGIIGAASKDQ